MDYCTLDYEINKCPYFNKNDFSCNNEKSCSYKNVDLNRDKRQNTYIRKERWYEKYYKK